MPTENKADDFNENMLKLFVNKNLILFGTNHHWCI